MNTAEFQKRDLTSRFSPANLLVLAALIALLAPGQAQPAAIAEIVEWQFDGFYELSEIPEPSGLCYCPDRDSLFVVNDGGMDVPPCLFELSLDTEVIASLEIGSDLEGVCFCPVDGMLYVADEEDERVYVVDPDGLKQIGEFQLSRDFQGELLLEAGGNGIEGIEFISDLSSPGGGYFLLLNQDDPHCLLRIDYASIKLDATQPVEAVQWWPIAPVNLGELCYVSESQELWVIHSWMNVMEVLDIETMELKRWEVVPGSAQEAVALDGQGRLWIGYDSGGMACYLPPPVSKPSKDTSVSD